MQGLNASTLRPQCPLWSLADICGAKRDVRFTPNDRKSGHPMGEASMQGKLVGLLPRPKATSCCRLDQWRTGNSQFAGHSRSFLD